MKDIELQKLLDDSAERFGVVGAQLAIFDGQRQREFVTGYRNLEHRLPVTADTLFQIGSTTKLFNAALVLSLVDIRQLDLDRPVCQYIRNFHLASAEAEECVTLRHLLSMSSGLDNGPYYDFGRGEDATRRYIEALCGIPQIFPPGAAYGYSNASTIVAGHVAERIAGQPWELLVSERIWAPLGLKQSALFAEDLLFHPIALGYKAALEGEMPERMLEWSLPRSMAPAGGLTCCSAGDLIRLARMFLDRGKSVDGGQVISGSAIEEMLRPQVKMPTQLIADEWCLGPSVRRWGGNLLYGHSGTNVSGSSMLLWCPERNMAVSTVVNVSRQGYPLAAAILDVVLPQMFAIQKPASPTPHNVIPVQTELHPFLGRFESFGSIQMLQKDGEKLTLTSTTTFAPETDVTSCELIPLGGGRFLPRDSRLSANRNWDIAFWGRDSSGRATHMLNGIFALRRTS